MIDVHNVPSNTTLMLVRGGRVVNSIITGPSPLGFISLEDNVGVPAPGSYTYQVVQSEPNQAPVSLGQITLQVLTGISQAGVNQNAAVTSPGPAINATNATGNNTATPALTNTTVTSPVTAVPTAALSNQASSAVLNRFLDQFGSVTSAASAKTLSAPVANPSTPVAPVTPVTTATPGNQVTLNQFFGKVKTAPTPAPQRFSLFHHKDRKTIKTVAVNGADIQAAVAAPSTALTNIAAPPSLPPAP